MTVHRIILSFRSGLEPMREQQDDRLELNTQNESTSFAEKQKTNLDKTGRYRKARLGSVFICVIFGVLFLTSQIKGPPKNIICMVYPRAPNEESVVIDQMTWLDQQTKFAKKNWSLHFYMNERSADINSNSGQNAEEVINKYRKQFKMETNVKIHTLQNGGSNNIGRNIYDAILTHCQKQSIVFIFRQNESINSNSSLERVYHAFGQNQSNVGIISPIVFQKEDSSEQSIHQAPDGISTFRRDRYFAETSYLQVDNSLQKTNNLTEVRQIMQHFRIFRSEWYRRIPFIHLMYDNETFYESFLAFQLPLIEYASQPEKIRQFNQIDKLSLPLKLIILQEPLFKATGLEYLSDPFINLKETLLVGSLHTFFAVSDVFRRINFYSNLKGVFIPKIWSSQLNVLKRSVRKSSDPDLIPKIIHQIWIGGDIPDIKLKLMSRFKDLMPDFQYKLWGNENLTEANFPMTHSKIQKLLQLDKTSEYSRMAMISDLMRLEILYYHGGFYFDTNFEPFQNIGEIENIRKHQFVVILQLPPFLGSAVSNGLIFAKKESPYLLKLLTKQKMDAINLRSKSTNLETGPVYLNSAFSLEDIYFNIKIFPSTNFYPYIKWSSDQRYKISKCTILRDDKIPDLFAATFKDTLGSGQQRDVFPCGAAYPDAYGMNHLNFGGSWEKQK